MERNQRTGLAVACACVCYLALYRSFPAIGDVLLGLPLGRAYADPGLYPEADLLISSGLRGPFHLYKYVGGLLFSLDLPIDIIWYGCFILVSLATFVVLWNMFTIVGKVPLLSSIACALLVTVHPLRGSLLASGLPVGGFVTAQLALPLAFYAIILILQRRHVWAMIVAGCTFLVHPYVGLLTVAPVGCVVMTTQDLRVHMKLRAMVAGLLVMAPNILYLLSQLPENFFAGVAYEPSFQDQFRLYALHAFIDTHWREGFGWFFIVLVGALMGLRLVPPEQRRGITVMGAVWFGLMGVYAANTITLEHPAVYLSFLFRATYFLKPLCLILFLVFLRWVWFAYPDRRRIVVVACILFFAGGVLPMSLAVLADALSCIAMGLLVPVVRREQTTSFHTRVIVLCAVLALVFAGIAEVRPESKEMIQNSVVALVIILAVGMWSSMRETITLPIREIPSPAIGWTMKPVVVLLAFHHLLISAKDWSVPLIPQWENIRHRIQFMTPPPRSAGLLHWATSQAPRGSLFAIPPDDEPELGAFRLITGRGVYATVGEVNQIAFDRARYNSIHRRLVRIGVRVYGPRRVDATGYSRMSAEEVGALHSEEGVDFFVVQTGGSPMLAERFQTAYADSAYEVYDLGSSFGEAGD